MAAFLATVAAALAWHWQAADIVWSMWVSSIVTGYAMILVAIGSGMWRGRNLMRRDEAVAERVATPVVLIGGLFMFAFFSVHFLMFHYGHAAFTRLFFPLADIPASGGMPGLDRILMVTLAAYWPVVLASLVSRQEGFRAALVGNPAKAMTLPYHYVMKNHVTIFIVAILNAMGLGNYVLYAVFAWYYFPFELPRRDATPA